MVTLIQLLAPYAARAEAEMRAMVPPLDTAPSFFGQMHYHLGWANEQYEPEEGRSGKRVRAAFCLMTCEALAGSLERALPAAAAIELLHEFSLVHDDIEDGDRQRRHRATLWVLEGVPQAINTGDGLFALTQTALLRSTERGVPAERVLHAQRRLNEVALHLCVGQHLDMSFQQREAVTPEEYLTMIGGKTVALLAFAGEAGAMMAGADEESVAALRQVGEAMGLAFQMQDDLLGLWGEPGRTGKPVGADIRAKKKSLPIAYALSQPGAARLRALYAGPIESDAEVAEVNQLVEETGAREHVSGLIREQEERAISLLGRVATPPEALNRLRQLVELLSHRDR
ncbi:MAG TPA: polyprenyl synthetase family protein [Ardenticatenaceae bacterium]|jgi:geranylgeranyl diphosphate synthase type I